MQLALEVRRVLGHAYIVGEQLLDALDLVMGEQLWVLLAWEANCGRKVPLLALILLLVFAMVCSLSLIVVLKQ